VVALFALELHAVAVRHSAAAHPAAANLIDRMMLLSPRHPRDRWCVPASPRRDDRAIPDRGSTVLDRLIFTHCERVPA